MNASSNPLVRLEHITDEIAGLGQALDGVTFSKFRKEYVLRRTTEHALLIISEAIKALSPEFTDHYSGVDWRAVRDIGNFLRHQYYEVDARTLWEIATERLPALQLVVDQMKVDEERKRELRGG